MVKIVPSSSRIITRSNPVGHPYYSRRALFDQSSTGRERPWKVYKQLSKFLAEACQHLGYERLAVRIDRCADRLWFLECMESEEHPKKLKSAYFCKHRLCPDCQWRRSLRQFHTSLELAQEALERHPTLKFVFLTLTVPNVSLRGLSDGIDGLFESWQRLTQRKEVRSAVRGYLRTLEVTYNHQRDDWHPHIHAVLVVPSSYFKTDLYITQQRWLKLWQQSTRMPQITQVDIRKIKTNRKGIDPLALGFAEASKYGLKPWSTSSRISVNRLLKKKRIPRNLKGHAWLRETVEETGEVVGQLIAALERRRLVQVGGILKDIKRELKLKDGEDEGADLVNVTGEKTGCKCSVCGGDMFEHSYVWNRLLANYYG